MSGQLSFIDIEGQELANSYRTRSYILRGLAGSAPWNLTDLGCEILGREIGGTEPFVSPSVDPAPWYDATVPESAEFLGLYVVDLDFQTLDVRRSISQRFGGIGGGVIGFEQVGARAVAIRAYLMASSCAGMEYGRHWIYSKLGSDCASCSLRYLRVRDSCPPSDGSDDTRGEWIIYDAALVDGIKRESNPGFPCCDYDPITFTLAGESPYLYKRPTTGTAGVEVQSNGAIMPPAPTVLDTMVRANTGPPPSASWTGVVVNGTTNNLRIVSNQLDNAAAASIASAYWNAATFGPDISVSVVMPTRVNTGDFYLYGRVTTPGTSSAANYLRVQLGTGAASDTISLGRYDSATITVFASKGGFTFANGDTFVMLCRGQQIEGWRVTAAGAATRLISAYDPTTPATGNVGVAIASFNAVGQHLGAFGAQTLTTPVYPVDPVVVTIPAVSVGITSPIITLTAATIPGNVSLNSPAGTVVTNTRIQLKQYANCSESDDFATNDLATRWWQSSAQYTISTGKLRPLAVGSSANPLMRSSDGSLAGRLLYRGGRVEAQVTLGATITNGSWGVVQANSSTSLGGLGAYLVRTAGTNSNVFLLGAPDAAPYDSAAYTPVAGHTYRIILEMMTTSTTGSWDMRGYLVDQAQPTVMVTRPLRATITLAGTGPLFTPSIQSTPADTGEAWDSFYAIDYAAEPSYLDVKIPRGVITIDGSRRVSAFTPNGSTTSVDGSQYLSTPAGTPLGWPDVCAGTGQGCLQIFAGESDYPGVLVSVAQQSRTR